MNLKELMIVGLQTDFCIDDTIKSAFERKYTVYIPEDTNSTFSKKYMDNKTTYNFYNKWIWPDTFGKCISFKEVISLLEK